MMSGRRSGASSSRSEVSARQPEDGSSRTTAREHPPGTPGARRTRGARRTPGVGRTPRTRRAPGGPEPAGSGTFALAAAVLGFFIITLDSLVVNVALPSIGVEVGGGVSSLQWVVDGYTLMFASFMLSAGSLIDRIGAAQVYRIGLTLFTLASVACGFSTSLGMLVAARLAQGCAASVIMPASLALIRQAYPDGRPRVARARDLDGGRGDRGRRRTGGRWRAHQRVQLALHLLPQRPASVRSRWPCWPGAARSPAAAERAGSARSADRDRSP